MQRAQKFEARGKIYLQTSGMTRNNELSGLCGHLTCLRTSLAVIRGLFWIPVWATKHVYLKHKVVQIFLQKNVLFGNNKELQSRTCNYGGPHRRPLKLRRGNSFYRGEEKVGEILQSFSFVLCDQQCRAWELPLQTFYFLCSEVDLIIFTSCKDFSYTLQFRTKHSRKLSTINPPEYHTNIAPKEKKKLKCIISILRKDLWASE